MGSREVLRVDNTGCSPRCYLPRCFPTQTLTGWSWSRARAAGLSSLWCWPRSGEDLAALLVTRRASTSMSGWLGCLLPTRTCLPHEETRVSWEARLEATRPDEVQDEATRLGEQCEGEAGCKRVNKLMRSWRSVNYLRRGRESREEEGGRLGPLGSGGLGGFHISIFATSKTDFFIRYWTAGLCMLLG